MMTGLRGGKVVFIVLICMFAMHFPLYADEQGGVRQNEWIQVEMKEIELGEERIYVQGNTVRVSNKIPEEESLLPDFRSGTPLIGKVSLLGGEIEILLALDEKNGEGTGHNLLYVDTNRNGSLLDEQPILTKSRLSLSEENVICRSSFDEIGITLDDRDIYFRVELEYYWLNRRGQAPEVPSRFADMRLFPTRCMSGEVTLGDVPYKVVLMDSNLNGRYNDLGRIVPYLSDEGAEWASLRSGGDFLYVGQTSNTQRLLEGLARNQLGRYLSIGGALYEIGVESNGREVQFRQVGESDLGQVDIPLEDYTLILVSEENGGFHFSGKEKVVRLPVGNYRIERFWYSQTHEGTVFHASARGTYATPVLEIKRNETVRLPVGPPFEAGVRIRNPDIRPDSRGDRVYRVEFTLTGSGKEIYSGLQMGDKRPRPPQLSILSSRGSVIQRTHFEWG